MRARLLPSNIVATDLTTGVGTPGETTVNTNVSYWSGPATATMGKYTGTVTHSVL